MAIRFETKMRKVEARTRTEVFRKANSRFFCLFGFFFVQPTETPTVIVSGFSASRVDGAFITCVLRIISLNTPESTPPSSSRPG